jgi:hypothetical protein
MNKIKSISLRPEDFESLAILRRQLGWSDSKIVQVLIEQARIEGKVTLQAAWPPAVTAEATHV